MIYCSTLVKYCSTLNCNTSGEFLAYHLFYSPINTCDWADCCLPCFFNGINLSVPASPPNHCLCLPKRELRPLSEDCAPKKVTRLVLLEWSSRPETPKRLVFFPEFVSMSCFFASFAIKTFLFFLVFTPDFVEIFAYFATKIFFWSSLQN